MHATDRILINLQSPRGGEIIVTHMMTGVDAEIASVSKEMLCLENRDAVREWGYAKEYL